MPNFILLLLVITLVTIFSFFLSPIFYFFIQNGFIANLLSLIFASLFTILLLYTNFKNYQKQVNEKRFLTSKKSSKNKRLEFLFYLVIIFVPLITLSFALTKSTYVVDLLFILFLIFASIIQLWYLFGISKITGIKDALDLNIKITTDEINLASLISNLENFTNVIVIASILAIIFSPDFIQSNYIRAPIILCTLLSLVFVAGNYIFRPDDLIKRAPKTISQLLFTSLILSILIFIYLASFLSALMNNIFFALIISAIILSILTTFFDDYILRKMTAIIFKEKSIELSQKFINSFSSFSIMSIILIIIFSDSPLVYSLISQNLSSQNIIYIIIWFYGFITFIFGEIRKRYRDITYFELSAGLKDRTKLQSMFE